MKQLQNLREAIIIAHNRGKKQAEIADFLGISQGAVSKTIKRFEKTQPHGLHFLVDSPRKSVSETPPERRITETSVEESLERNYIGDPGQDRGQLSEALKGLH